MNLAEPLLSIITNISLEHTQMLGNTLSEIAREKAGIMRVGRPVVIAHQANEAMAVLCDEATRINAQPVIAESGWHCEPSQHALGREGSGQWFAVSLRYHDHAPFFVPLLGAVQLQNAAAVLAACDALERVGLHIDEPAIRAGLAQTRWRGRFELLGFDPLVIADGAHTPYSMQQLCASLHDYFPNQRIHFIVGILRDKDGRGMLEAKGHTLQAANNRWGNMQVVFKAKRGGEAQAASDPRGSDIAGY